MRRLVLPAVILAACLAGCGKKAAKPAPDVTPTPATTPAPQPVSATTGSVAAPNQAGNLTVNGGAGGVHAPRMAAGRIANEAQLKDLQLSMFQTWTLDNRVPTADEIMKDAQKNAQLFPLLKEGVVVLTNTTRGDGVWAYTLYPQRANEHYVITQQGVAPMSADELQSRLETQKSPVKLAK